MIRIPNWTKDPQKTLAHGLPWLYSLSPTPIGLVRSKDINNSICVCKS